ncbi:MAG: phosphatase PAP2 family protein [Chitinophagaceae bacterium]|nr:phosphatase PAP2 family protein [Chitinophagaceae bacterium]
MPGEQAYKLNDGRTLVYSKPKPFGFLAHVPKDAAGIAKAPFCRKAIEPLLFIAGSTALLMFADQSASNMLQEFSSDIHLHAEEDYKNIVDVPMGKKQVSLFKAPCNLNTGIYQFGQGFPSLLIGAGLFAYGKIHHDYRSLNTAGQLAETFILMGAGTQLLKRITGRQSPSDATKAGGAWHFFPSFKSFQQHTPRYDAFPSGHLATVISTITVLADNYPEKQWIRPVGYSISGLLGMAMINNKVHWASDYPLAIALGYVCAKQVVKNNRRILRDNYRKHPNSLSYSFAYANKTFLPSVKYSF